jgi:hypothetical protein
MDPSLIAAIAVKNSSDLEALIGAVGGIGPALKLWPHISAIIATVQAHQPPPGAGGQSGGGIGQ